MNSDKAANERETELTFVNEYRSDCSNDVSVIFNKKILSSDNSTVEPSDPIPNSAVKRSSADGSVGVPM